MALVDLGVVLAGGLGIRLGADPDRPKALIGVGGKTLLARAVETVTPLCETVAVVAPERVVLPEMDRARRVLDAGKGPLAAILAACGELPPERVLVLGVDFPLVRMATFEALAEELGDAPAVLPAPDGVPQPLVAIYTRAGIEGLQAAHRARERSVWRAAVAHGACLLDDAACARLPGGAETLLNVNTPEDLARAERILAGAAA